MREISIDDVSDGDVEAALMDEAEGIASEPVLDGRVVIALQVGKPSPQLARKLRNLFSPKALMAAERELNNANPAIRSVAQRFMDERGEAVRRWCMNPTCLEYLGAPITGKRGRKRLYCSNACQTAAGSRRYRDKHDPGRSDHLNDRFLLPRYVRPGYTGRTGNRRKRASIFGFDSIITPEIQASRHAAAVQGAPDADGRLLEMLVDGEWTRKKKRQKAHGLTNRQIALEVLAELEKEISITRRP